MASRRPSVNASSFLSTLYSSSDHSDTFGSEGSLPDSGNSALSEEDYFSIQDAIRARHPSFGAAMNELDIGNSFRHSATDIRAHLQDLTLIGSAPSPHYIPSPKQEEQSSMGMSPAARFLSSPELNPEHAQQRPSHGGGTLSYRYHVPGYILGPTIGVGGQSVIKKAESETSGGTVAVKLVHLASGSKSNPFSRSPSRKRKHWRQLCREARIWESLSHEHVLPLFTSTFAPNDHSEQPECENHTSVYFVTLHCPAGSLLDILQRSRGSSLKLPQDDAGMMFRQVARGLRYMHDEKRLIHGDIKLENVLVDEMGTCKIADFGMATWMGAQEETTEDSSHEESDGGGRHPRGEQKGEVGQEGGCGHNDQSGIKNTRNGPRPVHLSLRRPNAGFVSRHVSISNPYATSSRHPSHSLRETRRTRHKSVHPSFPRGSLPYASPEILYRPNDSAETAACPTIKCGTHPAQDIWALGVLLYILLVGKFPFHDLYEPRLVDKIIIGTFSLPEGIGQIAEDVLTGCLQRDYTRRWNIALVDENAWGVGWGDHPASTPSSQHPSYSASHKRDSRRSSTVPLHQITPAAGAPASTEELISTSAQNSTSLLHSTRPSTLPQDLPSNTPYLSDEEDDEDGHIYASRGRRPPAAASYQSHSRSSSNVYHPTPITPVDFERNSSRSRSTSRPPRNPHPRVVPLEPITTRVSVSVERHAGYEVQTQRHSESPLLSPTLEMCQRLDRWGRVPPAADNEEDEYIGRQRSTVTGRVVGRSSKPRISTSQSHSRSRSRVAEVSPSPGPLTPQDREPLSAGIVFPHPYHQFHQSHNHRASKFELNLPNHEER